MYTQEREIQKHIYSSVQKDKKTKKKKKKDTYQLDSPPPDVPPKNFDYEMVFIEMVNFFKVHYNCVEQTVYIYDSEYCKR